MGKKDFSNNLELLKREDESLLGFLKAKYPMFHNSIFFYRDLQYGVLSFMEKKGNEITYAEAGRLADAISEEFEIKGIFVRMSNTGWKINYPEFATTEPGDPF
jgi:hypothetical protein